MRAPTWSRHSTPSASDMRRSEPKRLTATGYRDFPPPCSVACVNSSAGPPPGDFMQRSATSVISLSTETGRATRVRSPALSIAATTSRRLSSAMVDRADAAGQALEPDARESRCRESLGQCLRLRKCEHGLWQVGIGVSMFRHEPPDGGQNSPEVEEVDRAQRREPGRGEFEDDEAGAGFQDPGRFAEAPVEVGEIAYAKSHQRAVEPRRGKRQLQRVGGDRDGAKSFALALRQHRNREVGADHATAEAALPGELGGEVECAGAEV